MSIFGQRFDELIRNLRKQFMKHYCIKLRSGIRPKGTKKRRIFEMQYAKKGDWLPHQMMCD